MKKPKITILGAGNVGSTAAARITSRGLGDVFLYDVVSGLAIGKAMDISQAYSLVSGSNCLANTSVAQALEDADIVVITGGHPRSQGLSRDDLFSHNSEIILQMAQDIRANCPAAVVLIVTNPVDALATIMKRAYPNLNIMGLGCALDTVRFQYFLAQRAGVSCLNVNGIVIGTHNDFMVPLVSSADIGGYAAEQWLSREQLEEVKRQTRTAGHKIVQNLVNFGSFVAAAKVVCDIVESILRDKKEVFSLDVFCQGPYGVDGYCVSLPVITGEKGINQVLSLDLNPEETNLLNQATEHLKQVVDGA